MMIVVETGNPVILLLEIAAVTEIRWILHSTVLDDCDTHTLSEDCLAVNGQLLAQAQTVKITSSCEFETEDWSQFMFVTV